MDVELYETYGPMVLRRCRKLLSNEDDALDAMQDVFVEVLSHYEIQNIEFPSSLFYRIATNVCLNKIRKGQRHKNMLITQEQQLLQNISHWDNNENMWLLNKVFVRFSKKQTEQTQTILVMYLVDEMTLKSISELLNVSLSSVQRRIKTALLDLEDLRGRYEQG